MKSFFLKMLIIAVRGFIKKGVFDIISDMVASQVSSDLSGDEKRKAVHNNITNLKKSATSIFADVSKSAINMALEVAVARIKS